MGTTVAWQYLGGQVRAADSRDERQVEWPPHPGRVWLALASCWFVSGQSPVEQAALDALRQAPEPQLWVPAGTGGARQPVGVYVPVNDTAGGNSPFGHLPLGRNRQERFFPALHVGEMALCALHWPDLTLPDDLLEALEGLVGRLAYLGQATSMVRAWVWRDATPPPGTMVLDTLAAKHGPVWHLRAFGCGFSLAELARWHAAGRTPIPRGWLPYGLREQTPFLPGSGREVTVAAGEGVARGPVHDPGGDEGAVGSPMAMAGVLEAPSPGGASAPPSTPWASDLTFLLQVSGMVLPVTDILAVVYGLRQEMARRCALPLPSWLTGHQPDGEPVRQNTWYTAVFPVAHLGVEGSNGRLAGLALARPRTVPGEVWAATLSPLLSPAGFSVTLPGGGRVTFQAPVRPFSGAFHPSLWTGGDEGSEVWATTTPMVTDRFLPASPGLDLKDRLDISVRYSCRLAGLPEPVEVVIRRAPWWAGSFPAWGRDGDGPYFPPDWRFQRRNLPRFHVWLRFPVPVQGPLALGRLRFQGYGLFWAVPSGIPLPRPERRLALRFRRDMSSPGVFLKDA